MAKRRRQPSPPCQEDSTSDLDSLFFPTSAVTASSPEKPVQRNAANARERARMRVLSRAFSRLKTSLPWVPPDTKLSKLDTLRLAATYIAHLRKILKEDSDGHTKKTVHPLAFPPETQILDSSLHGCNDQSVVLIKIAWNESPVYKQIENPPVLLINNSSDQFQCDNAAEYDNNDDEELSEEKPSSAQKTLQALCILRRSARYSAEPFDEYHSY
ncbi:Transcription factor 21 [Araneus ventricosus]|uniref:Transcription factor 21 n=1 Tax=Araneus ventricosus TaxID=182803 RepID=A0A4Y2KBD4_ARAVE|nr:Transcription factor 21 [Araneus ventricosus]